MIPISPPVLIAIAAISITVLVLAAILIAALLVGDTPNDMDIYDEGREP